jgi:hypothetical protein
MPTERDLLLTCLEHSGGILYDRTVPYDAGSYDCVRLTYAVLSSLWPVLLDYHADIHLLDAARPFSPVEAIEAAGIGLVSSDPIPGRWHLAQGWVSLDPLKDGHAWIWYHPPVPVAAKPFIIQATSARPPWNERRTLEQQTARFKHIQWAALQLDMW